MNDTVSARQASLEMDKLREVGQAFFAQHPVGTVLTGMQLLQWAEVHGGGSYLESDLLIGRVSLQLNAIRRHLNAAGANRDLPEANRFCVGFTDRSRTDFVVRSLRLSTQSPSEADPTTGEKRRRGRQPRPAPLLDLLESIPPSSAQHEENVDACRAQPPAEMKRRPGRPKGSKNKPKVTLPLAEAIAAVKAAGYRVSKPRKPKIFKRGKDRVGPTFVAEFADGVTTRMSVYTSLEKLDWNRGTHLAQAAYQSRWRMRARQERGLPLITLWGPAPPAIVSARFEQDGKILAQRTNGNAS